MPRVINGKPQTSSMRFNRSRDSNGGKRFNSAVIFFVLEMTLLQQINQTDAKGESKHRVAEKCQRDMQRQPERL